MESKLETARQLLLREKPDDKEALTKYNEDRVRGFKIMESLCQSDFLSPQEKLGVVEVFCEVSSEDGEDMINRWRDSIPHLKGESKKTLFELLILVCLSPKINSFFRINIAITFYNHGEYTLCYECFSKLAKDPSLIIEHRIEAAKYLYVSNSEEYVEVTKEVVSEVIQTFSLPSDYRYLVIASFISPATVVRIKSIFNSEKLNTYYDEKFVKDLQVCFFEEGKNNVRERILSGQHLLQMETLEKEYKDKVCRTLLEFACDQKLSENEAADAADVVYRLGDKLQSSKAASVIAKLGGGSTVYTNSQNVHNKSIDRYANEYIEKLIEGTQESKVKLRSFFDVHREVGDCIRKFLDNPKDKDKAYGSLNRISIDTATFTSLKVTIAEIFVHVWMKILSYDGEVKDELKKRMVDELVDMGGTCSSGHSTRLVNVLSVYDSTLRISWEDQIKANVSGRMNAAIRDSGMREQVAVGMFEEADEVDRVAARNFINEQLELLRRELWEEFVEQGYLKEEEFDLYLERSAEPWIIH